jgi:hypothetical protein
MTGSRSDSKSAKETTKEATKESPKEAQKRRLDQALEEGLEETFPGLRSGQRYPAAAFETGPLYQAQGLAGGGPA